MLQIYPHSQISAPDKKMFKQMYDVAEPAGNNGWYFRSEFGVYMEGSLTNEDKARLTIHVDNSEFDPATGPDRHSWCEVSFYVPGSIVLYFIVL